MLLVRSRNGVPIRLIKKRETFTTFEDEHPDLPRSGRDLPAKLMRQTP
jgi:hypothetical protein